MEEKGLKKEEQIEKIYDFSHSYDFAMDVVENYNSEEWKVAE
jgi:hypothetical protein